jgi:hypothetical protein
VEVRDEGLELAAHGRPQVPLNRGRVLGQVAISEE